MKQKKCKHCGCEIPVSAKFCPHCGAESTSPRHKKAPFIIVSLIVALAVSIAGTLYWLKDTSLTASPSLAETQIEAGSGTLYVPASDSYATDEETGISYVNDIVLIFFELDATQEQIDQAITATGGTVVGSLPVINQYQVQVEASTLQELQNRCERLNEMDGVVQASYDPVVPIGETRTSNDPWPDVDRTSEDMWQQFIDGVGDAFKSQEDKFKEKTWWLDAIHAQGAWEYNDQLSSVRIGIMDSGFNTEHEDLKNKIHLVNKLNLPGSHGTRCAGIIGAEANNGLGMAGLVWKGDLDLWDLALTEEQEAQFQGAGSPNYNSLNLMYGGVVSLIEDGCKVINVSQGQSGFYTMYTDPETGSIKYRRSDADKNPAWDMTLEEWISFYSDSGKLIAYYLLPLLEKDYDFVIVQAADNGDSNHFSVDARLSGLFTWITLDKDNITYSDHYSSVDLYDRIIVVGSAQPDGKDGYIQASYSNAGSRVDICAPGADIYSTDVNNTYTFGSGTSFAAPIVSGVVGLVWAANPDLTGEQVKSIICYDDDTHTDIVADNTEASHPLVNSYPLVNAEECVKAALELREDSTDNVSENGIPKGNTADTQQDQRWLLIEKSEYGSDSQLRSQTNYTYTSDGTLESSTEIQDSGRIDAEETWRTECIYDAAGNIIEEKNYYNDETEPENWVNRTFDEHGNLTQENYSGEIAFGGLFTYEYTYDASGRIQNVKCYHNGDLYTDTTYTYSESGHTEEMFCYLIAFAHTMTTYDQNGNISKFVNYMDDGSTQETLYTYEYDESGNKTSEVQEDLTFDSTSERTWTYTYDGHGNITECQEFYNNSLVSVTKYTYQLLSKLSGQGNAESPEETGSTFHTNFEFLERCTRYQGHFYRIIDGVNLTWDGAKLACESDGGHLATITSQEEQELIQSLNTDNKRLWIGGYQDTDGNWRWVTDEPWDYTNWGDGEPNNSSNVVAGESCVALWPESWNDLANENVYEQEGYVFEWDEPVVSQDKRGDVGAFVGDYDNPNATDMNTTYSISIQSDGTWNWSGNRTKMSGISYEKDGQLYLIATAAQSYSNADLSGWSNTTTQISGVATIHGDGLTITWKQPSQEKNADPYTWTESMVKKGSNLELSSYMGTSLAGFLETFPAQDLQKLNTTDTTTEYQNEYLTAAAGGAAAGYGEDVLTYLSIDAPCAYLIYGLSYGIPIDNAISQLQTIPSCQETDDRPNYKRFSIGDSIGLTIFTDGTIVTGITLMLN